MTLDCQGDYLQQAGTIGVLRPQAGPLPVRGRVRGCHSPFKGTSGGGIIRWYDNPNVSPTPSSCGLRMVALFDQANDNAIVGRALERAGMALATKEQSAALAALRNRSAQNLPNNAHPQASGGEAATPAAPLETQEPAVAGAGPASDGLAQKPFRDRGADAMLVALDDVGDEGADTTQISLRLPRTHLRALRHWAAEQTVARSDARTVTAQQIILKLIEGAVRHREETRG